MLRTPRPRVPKPRIPRLDWIAKVLADPPVPAREERPPLRLVAEGTRSPGRRRRKLRLVGASEKRPLGRPPKIAD